VLACIGQQLDLRQDLRQLPSIALEVDPTELVADIGRRAQPEFIVSWEWSYHHFVTEPDEAGRRFQAPLHAYVAEDGAFAWMHGQLEGLTINDIIRTQEEGIFQGDPFALLIEEPLGGDGVLPGWDDCYRFLAGAGAMYGGIKALIESAKVLRGIVDSYRRQWEIRYGTPHHVFAQVLVRERWDYPKLARLLNISLAACVDLLVALGYEQDQADPRMYRLSDALPQAQLRKDFEERVVGVDPLESRTWFWQAQGTTPPDWRD
jgi:hypothetical protein